MAKSNFAKFGDKLETLAEKGLETTLKGFSDISEYINTGNLMLNAALTGSLFGGYPNARSICLAGEPSTGKTFLCLNAAREAQSVGYCVFYIDTEGALDKSDFVNFGVDISPDKFRYYRMGTVREVKTFVANIVKLAKENPDLKLLIFIDSIGMLETEKERINAAEGSDAQDMGSKAKQLRSAFRNFTLDLSNLHIPLIFTNHLGDDPGNPKSGKKAGGGKGPEYAASIIIYLGKGQLKDGETRTGIIVKVRVQKNRLAKPVEGVEIHISHLKGMNRYVGCQTFMSWEGCGVARAKKLTQKEFLKLKEDEKKEAKPFQVGEETFYIIESTHAKNYIIKWTGEAVPVKYLFTNQVFTDRVLKELDDNIIRPMFKYSTMAEVIAAEEQDLALDEEVDAELEETE